MVPAVPVFVPHKGFVRIVQVSFNTPNKYDYPFDVIIILFLAFEDHSGNQLLVLETIVMWTEQKDPLIERSYLKC